MVTSRSRTSAKKAGVWMENAWRDLMLAAGLDADRLRLRGNKDVGDVGVRELKEFVFECKNTSRLDLPSAWKEAEKEVENANARFGFIIHKRHGNNKINEQWATCSTGTLARLLMELVVLKQEVELTNLLAERGMKVPESDLSGQNRIVEDMSSSEVVK